METLKTINPRSTNVRVRVCSYSSGALERMRRGKLDDFLVKLRVEGPLDEVDIDVKLFWNGSPFSATEKLPRFSELGSLCTI